MEFNLLSVGWEKGGRWFDLCQVKWGCWEPSLLRLSYHYGKWDWDLFGLTELYYYWKIKR